MMSHHKRYLACLSGITEHQPASLKILTKDSVTVYVNAIMYYKVRDSNKAVANVDDYSMSTRLLAATTLRNILGTRNLGEILSERDSIAQEMKVSSCQGPSYILK